MSELNYTFVSCGDHDASDPIDFHMNIHVC